VSTAPTPWASLVRAARTRARTEGRVAIAVKEPAVTAASRTIVFVASWRQYCSTYCTAARNPPRHRIDRFGAPKHLRDIRLEAVIGDRDRLPAIRSSPTRRSLEPASARLLRSPPSALFHESSLFRLGLARSTRELSASAPARRFARGGVVAVGRIGDKPPTIFRDAALTRSTLTSHRSFLQIAPVIVSTPWRRTPQSQQQVSVQSGRRPLSPAQIDDPANQTDGAGATGGLLQ